MTQYLEEILQPEVQAFIRDHANHDPFALSLQAKKYPHLPIQAIAEQIGARQKARQKLPEWHQTQSIVFPPGISIEQSSSERTAKYKSTLVNGHQLIDLTGGMGVDTYYLSQNFAETHYVEQNAELAIITQHNFSVLGKKNIQVHNTAAEHFLQNWPQKADVIYLDPDRRPAHGQKTFSLADASPNVLDLLHELLQKANTILIKTSPLLDIDLAIRSLRFVDKVFVVAVDNECKEVLYGLQAGENDNPEISTVNLSSKGKAVQEFSFTRQQEETTSASFSEPLRYLYEPNAAVLKAGAFKMIASHYALLKLHPNSHLYTSDTLVSSFPGRTFVITHVANYDKKTLRKLLPTPQANISIRNFPDSVQKIRKKTGLKEGGKTYIFATIADQNKPILLITEKLTQPKPTPGKP